MTEAVSGEMGQDPSFQIQRVYLKDISLEQPNAPEILLNQGEPKLEVQVDIQANQLDDVNFHVTLIGSVTTKIFSVISTPFETNNLSAMMQYGHTLVLYMVIFIMIYFCLMSGMPA